MNKKIMFVIPSLEGGGAERVAANLLDALGKTGSEITLCLFGRDHNQYLPGNIRVRYLPVKSTGNFFYVVAKFFILIFYMRKIIKEEKPNSILSFMDYPNIVAILSNLLSGRRARINISVHTSPTLQLKRYSNNRWNGIISILMRLLYNKADKIIAVSSFIKGDLIKNYGIKESGVMVIYNPVDIEKINTLASEEISLQLIKEEVPIIISVGRLSREKGHEFLLKAFAIMRKKVRMRLVILGEGEEERNLGKLSRNLGINNDVVLLGYDKNPYKYMKRASIFVLSSLYEGFPNVLIEAMACGTPVISTQYNPYPHEIIEHGKNGLLVPVADENALAEAMLRLLNDKVLRKTLAEKAKKRIVDFSIEKITEQYKAVLDV